GRISSSLPCTGYRIISFVSLCIPFERFSLSFLLYVRSLRKILRQLKLLQYLVHEFVVAKEQNSARWRMSHVLRNDFMYKLQLELDRRPTSSGEFRYKLDDLYPF